MSTHRPNGATMTRKIDPTEWEVHKSFILQMRKSGVKMNGPNGIIDTMARKYGFMVTHSQMELQLSKWQERRKLSKIEWCRILRMVERCSEAGRSCSVKMNGCPIQKRVMDRKLRLYRRSTEFTKIRNVSQDDLPDCITIEVGKAPPIDPTDQIRSETFPHVPTDDQPQSTMLDETLSSTRFFAVLDHNGKLPESSFGVAYPSISTGADQVSHLEHLVSHSEHSNSTVSEDNGNFRSETMDMQVIGSSTSENQWPSGNKSISQFPVSPDMRSLTPSEQQILGFYSSPTMLKQTMGLLDSGFDPAKEGYAFPYECIRNGSEWLPSQDLLLDTTAISEYLPLQKEVRTIDSFQQEVQTVDSPSLFKPHSFWSGDDTLTSRQALISYAAMQNSLTALLPPNNSPTTELLCQRNLALNQVFTSPFFRVLISSIENNYAGLEKVPIGEVFRLLKNDAQMRSRLVQYIERTPKALGTALVEKLLMAAIEEQDAASVAELIGTQLVQVNNARCTLEGTQYTAIARSVMLPSPEVFWILLRAGADPTFNYSVFESTSILDLALRAMKPHGLTHLSMIQALLDHGVMVNANSVLTALELNDKDLINLILSEFDPEDDDEDDRRYYSGSASSRRNRSSLVGSQMEAILSAVFETFEEIVALPIIRQMIMKRGNWRKAPGGCIDRLATKATECGYFNALQLLLPLTATRAGPLAAAVRHRRDAIVDLLLVSDLQQALVPCQLNDENRQTTPLAEAIRLKESKTLESFEKHPQWKRLWSRAQNMMGLEVTLYAACEVGNLAYCQMILGRIRKLDKAPSNHRLFSNSRHDREQILPHGSNALHISVENGHEDIAICLINAGVCATFESGPTEGSHKDDYDLPFTYLSGKAHEGPARLGEEEVQHHCLYQAVHQRKRALFDKILESDFTWNDVLTARCTIYALKHKLKWALDGLLRSRPHYDFDFLEETFSLAIREGLKAEFDSIVLSHKLSIETHEMTGLFTGDARALNEAIKSGEVSVIEDFLASDSGSRLALTLTLEALERFTKQAIEKETSLPQASFAIILCSFKAQYPNGVRGFGGLLLHYAVLREDIALLDTMLEAKLDVNDRQKLNTALGAGCTALGAAIQHRCKGQLDFVRRILQSGADLNKCIANDEAIEDDKDIYAEEFRRKDQRYRKTPRTALLEAIFQEDLPLVQLLLEFGADIDQEARYGVKRTPLQAACEVGRTEIVDLLLDRGARADEAPAFRDGATSLQLCAAHGHVGTAIKLLDRGADIHASPAFTSVLPSLQGAASKGRLDMISLLWQRAGDRKFDSKACSEAMRLATTNGHAACSDLIRELMAKDYIAWDPMSYMY